MKSKIQELQFKKHFWSINKILIILFTTLVFSCKKKIETPKVVLPEATQVGANTVGCTIDGVNYRADGSEKKSGLASYYYYPNSIEHIPWSYPNMTISCFMINAGIEIKLIYLSEIGSVETYDVKLWVNKKGINYKLVTSKPHNLTFTNVTGLIRAGTFDFYVANENDSTDIKHITNGRFDIMDLY